MYVLLLLILLSLGADKTVKKQNPADTKNKSTQTEKAIPSPSSTPSPSTQEPHPERNGDANSKPSNDRAYKVEVEQTPPDYWMRAYVIINLFVAAAAVTSLFLIKHQRDVMKDQLQAMRDQLTEMKTSGEQTVQQMALMRESNDINRETLHAVHRAYVTFPFDMEGVRIPSEENEQIPKVWRMWIPMVNDGRTPTKDLRYRVNWIFRADGLPDDFTYPDHRDQRQDPRSSELAGGGKHLVPMEFNHADIRNLEGKKTRLFFYGWATYQDVFTGTQLHRTEFCHELTWTKINTDGRIEFAIGAYGPHNSSS